MSGPGDIPKPSRSSPSTARAERAERRIVAPFPAHALVGRLQVALRARRLLAPRTLARFGARAGKVKDEEVLPRVSGGGEPTAVLGGGVHRPHEGEEQPRQPHERCAGRRSRT